MATQLRGSVLRLPAAGKGPGVLALHAWWGLNSFFKDFCTRLARQGYVVLAPDLFHGKTASTITGAKKLVGAVPSEQVEADVLAAVAQLRAHPAVQGKSLGVIGFSYGAFSALWASQQRPEEIGAVTVFYGTGQEDFSKARAAYLGHFAEQDPFEPPAAVSQLEDLLKKAGRPATFYTYKGAGHWFFEKNRKTAYRAKAAALAWDRTLEFLHTQLGR